MIAKGDDLALLPEELESFGGSVEMVRRGSGSARLLARSLLVGAGFNAVALPRSRSGAPLWPPGVVGSLAHDDDISVAALAAADLFDGIGIDIEPALVLSRELAALVATADEIRRYPAELIESRTLFVVKEAVFKVLHPIDGVFLDFHDIETDLDAGIARTRHGKSVAIAFAASPRIIALGWVPAGAQ